MGVGSTKPVRSNIIQALSVGTVTGVGLWVTSLRSTSWNMARTSTRRFGHWQNSLVRRSSRIAQSPLGSVHPLRLPCSPALHRRICLITSRRVVPDCMTLPLFPSYLLVESISRRQRLMALASAPKQTRQEVTAAARELPSRQTVSTTSHAVSTRMHNRGAGR